LLGGSTEDAADGDDATEADVGEVGADAADGAVWLRESWLRDP
jgi:hypothetical protein